MSKEGEELVTGQHRTEYTVVTNIYKKITTSLEDYRRSRSNTLTFMNSTRLYNDSI